MPFDLNFVLAAMAAAVFILAPAIGLMRLAKPEVTLPLAKRRGPALARILNRIKPDLDLRMLVKVTNHYFRRPFADAAFDQRMVFLPICLKPLDCPAKTNLETGLLCDGKCPGCELGRLRNDALALGYAHVYVVPSSRLRPKEHLLPSDEFIQTKLKRHAPAAALGCNLRLVFAQSPFGKIRTGQQWLQHRRRRRSQDGISRSFAKRQELSEGQGRLAKSTPAPKPAKSPPAPDKNHGRAAAHIKIVVSSLFSASSLMIALCADALIGDPPRWPHMVRYMGRAISSLETLLRSRLRSPNSLRLAGGILIILVVGGSALISWAALNLSSLFWPPLSAALGVVLAFECLSAGQLWREARDVARPLKAGDLDTARARLAMIVGRDTAALGSKGIRRALIETIAENLSDGVVAPIFYLALGGPAAAVAYKAVNTLDSMVGYQSSRYRDLGVLTGQAG